MKIGTWWLSNVKMTVMVKTDESRRIMETAPIVRKFRGQNLDNLIRWMKSSGDTDIMLLRSGDDEVNTEAEATSPGNSGR